jgi:CoA-transferase family III
MSFTGSVRRHISASADVRLWLTTLDLKTEADRAILKKLVATADVFVESCCPGALAAGQGLPAAMHYSATVLGFFWSATMNTNIFVR